MGNRRSINNDYDSVAHLWWSQEGSLASIRYFINPVRTAYFTRALDRHFERGLRGLTALDVGCGGGFLSEELARRGLAVTGIDPSEKSIREAARHAHAGGLDIRYETGTGDRLPFPDGSLDTVFCCDVLEHVPSAESVVAEISRVLKSGGLFLFDTVNRTAMSWLSAIFFLQDCPLTAYNVRDRHVWRMFVKPAELRSVMDRHGIRCAEMRGITPSSMGPAILVDLHRAKKKRITFRELGRRMKFRESGDLSCSYMGYGIRSPQ
ncbi:MAG: 3-demethylubiquinone-9 3-O-methyltransferase [Spirochaetes bacterium]|nr:3-demethylubiquinone-9 3-O-methyltransferase [Spirochaetota bacterium]